MLEIKKKKRPASKSEINRLATLFKAKVPPEYVDFLTQHNGCDILWQPRDQPGAKESLHFLSVNEVLKTYPFIEKAYYEWGAEMEPGSFCHVPIATNGQSDYLAYVLWHQCGDSYPIWQIDHDDYPFTKTAEKWFKRADGLKDLLARLDRGDMRAF
jgi:hypothetical protein